MKIQFSDNNSFITITDDEGNYLKWLHSKCEKQYVRSFGKVDNREFKGIGLVWQYKGRGKISEQTEKKVYDIDNFFYHNSILNNR